MASFITSGAVTGAIAAGGTVFANGGDSAQVKKAALNGAAIGALSGAFGHSAALANALANVRGGLNSATSIARGNISGAMIEALSGLGFSSFERLMNNGNSCKNDY